MEGRLAPGHRLSLSLSFEWSLGKQNLNSRAKGHFFRCYKGQSRAANKQGLSGPPPVHTLTPPSATGTSPDHITWDLVSPHQRAQGRSYSCLHLSVSLTSEHRALLQMSAPERCPHQQAQGCSYRCLHLSISLTSEHRGAPTDVCT